MKNFSKNVMGGLFVAFYLMCFAFPIELIANLFKDHLLINQFLINQVITFFVVWVIGYFCSELYRDLLASANRPRSEDEKDEHSRNKQNRDEGKKAEKDAIKPPDSTSMPDD